MLVSMDHRVYIQPRMKRLIPHRFRRARESIDWIPPRFFTRHSNIMTHKRLHLHTRPLYRTSYGCLSACLQKRAPFGPLAATRAVGRRGEKE